MGAMPEWQKALGVYLIATFVSMYFLNLIWFKLVMSHALRQLKGETKQYQVEEELDLSMETMQDEEYEKHRDDEFTESLILNRSLSTPLRKQRSERGDSASLKYS